jgi:HEAT repeat protein
MRSSAAFAIGELTVIAEQDHLLAHWKTRTQTLKLFLAELQECVPMLVACLRDTEPMVRRQAVIALGKIKDKSAVLPMIDLLDPVKGSNELIQDISQALRSIGSHKLVREVIAKLSSS